MEWDNLLPIIIPSTIAIVGAFIGYFIKYFLDKKARFGSDTAIIKREMYEQYIDFMMEFVQNSKNYTEELTDEQTEHVLTKVREFHRKAVLYSSPKVINAFADFLQHAYKQSDDKNAGKYTMVLVTNVFKEMRRDIGLSNFGLRGGAIRLIRPVVNDYDEKIAPIEFTLINDARKAASAVSVNKGADR